MGAEPNANAGGRVSHFLRDYGIPILVPIFLGIGAALWNLSTTVTTLVSEVKNNTNAITELKSNMVIEMDDRFTGKQAEALAARILYLERTTVRPVASPTQ